MSFGTGLALMRTSMGRLGSLLRILQAARVADLFSAPLLIPDINKKLPKVLTCTQNSSHIGRVKAPFKYNTNNFPKFDNFSKCLSQNYYVFKY